MRRLFTLCIILGFSSISFAQGRGGGGVARGAGVFLDETFLPVYVNENDTSTVSDPDAKPVSGLGIDSSTTLGYLFLDQSLLVGLTYSLYSLTTERDNVQGVLSGREQSTSETKFGATLGWVGANLRVLFTWFLSGEKEVHTKFKDNSGLTGDEKVTNKDMTGFQLSAGYMFNMTSWLDIGPSLVYTSVSYKKQSLVDALNSSNNYSVTLNTKYVHATLQPMISLTARF